MLTFDVNPRDGMGASGCNTCCCQDATARPGETNKWRINYANWSVPLGGKGLNCQTTVSVEKIKSCPAPAGSTDPANTDYVATTTVNNAASGDLSVNATGTSLTYEVLPLYAPANGTLNIQADGTFTYTPNTGFIGYDFIYFTTSDGVNEPVINRLAIVVSPSLPNVALPVPADDVMVSFPHDRRSIDAGYHTLDMAMTVSPAAKAGDLYRVEIRQPALDCDGNCFWHVSCYDVVIGKC